MLQAIWIAIAGALGALSRWGLARLSYALLGEHCNNKLQHHQRKVI